MPNISTALSTASRSIHAFLCGFRQGVRDFFKSTRLIWRVIRFALHMSKRKVLASQGWANACLFREGFVEGFKSGSYEFWTPLRFTWRLLRTGLGKAVNWAKST